MTELYIIFFIIGVLVFAAIAAFSWWQQSGHQHSFQRRKKNDYTDPLFGNKVGNKAPVDKVSQANSTKQKATNSVAQTTEKDNKHTAVTPTNTPPIVDSKKKSGSNRTALPVVEMTSDEKPQNADQKIADNVEIIDVEPKRDKGSSTIVTELVAKFSNSDPIEQKQLLGLFRDHDFKFHRKVHIYGLNQLTDLWRDIEYELPSARFVELGVAIQLADREGGMSKKELHDFQQMVLGFSNVFDAPFEFSMDIDEALTQAKVLDQVGRRYDSMAVLNVIPRSKSGFRLADIESCMRDLGMVRDKNGIFLKTTGQKNQISILYRLGCTNKSGDFGFSNDSKEPIYDLVMYMNVPATKDPELMFQDMVKDTNSLATWLEGKIVDRDGKVMTQRSYSVLTQQISDIAFSMQQDGLSPGDALCKKLF